MEGVGSEFVTKCFVASGCGPRAFWARMRGMKDYMLLMHDDPKNPELARDPLAWDRYLEAVRRTGHFQGGSSVGSGACFARAGTTKAITTHIVGYLRVGALSLDDAKKFLLDNPVYEAGGTVEIRELPRE